MNQNKGEHRLEFLIRVLEEYMNRYGSYTLYYDDEECDGRCLYQEIACEVEMLNLTKNEGGS